MNYIVIKTYSDAECKSNTFRLQPDAANIVRQHQRTSGLTASYILSEIVRKTKDAVIFKENGDVQVP